MYFSFAISDNLDEYTALLDEQVLKESLADLLEFIVLAMIVDEEEREVSMIVLRCLLAVDHRVAEVRVYLLGKYIYELPLSLLLLPLVHEEHLQRLIFVYFCFPRLRLHLRPVVAEHLLKYAQVPLVLERYSRKQRIVIRCVLIKFIVADKDHLHLLHVTLLIHLERAAIDHFLQCRLALSRIILIVAEEIIHLVGELMALLEALMVRADENNAEVRLLEADVHVKHVFFGATGHTNWRPRLSIGHGAEGHHKVKDDSDV